MANSAFGILTIVHLIYLGVMFDQTELQTEGYKWTHTIDKWKSLDFFSHISMTSAFVLSFLLLTLSGATRFSGRAMTLLDPTYAKKYVPIIASVSEH